MRKIYFLIPVWYEQLSGAPQSTVVGKITPYGAMNYKPDSVGELITITNPTDPFYFRFELSNYKNTDCVFIRNVSPDIDYNNMSVYLNSSGVIDSYSDALDNTLNNLYIFDSNSEKNIEVQFQASIDSTSYFYTFYDVCVCEKLECEVYNQNVKTVYSFNTKLAEDYKYTYSANLKHTEIVTYEFEEVSNDVTLKLIKKLNSIHQPIFLVVVDTDAKTVLSCDKIIIDSNSISSSTDALNNTTFSLTGVRLK